MKLRHISSATRALSTDGHLGARNQAALVRCIYITAGFSPETSYDSPVNIIVSRPSLVISPCFNFYLRASIFLPGPPEHFRYKCFSRAFSLARASPPIRVTATNPFRQIHLQIEISKPRPKPLHSRLIGFSKRRRRRRRRKKKQSKRKWDALFISYAIVPHETSAWLCVDASQTAYMCSCVLSVEQYNRLACGGEVTATLCTKAPLFDLRKSQAGRLLKVRRPYRFPFTRFLRVRRTRFLNFRTSTECGPFFFFLPASLQLRPQ